MPQKKYFDNKINITPLYNHHSQEVKQGTLKSIVKRSGSVSKAVPRRHYEGEA
jgi:hypothetical protein